MCVMWDFIYILNLVIRMFGELGSVTETECLITYISRSRFLTVFIHRRGADDELLKTLGRNCPALQV